MFFCVFSFLFLTAFGPSAAFAAKPAKGTKAVKEEPVDKIGKPNASFDADKMGDMSDYDPANPIVPTGDTIKIAIVASFSGAAAANGAFYWNVVQWVAHDINKRGGILVDGKKKLVEVIKADHMSKADQCKKVCERMILQEKVHVLWGTDGSHMMKIINDAANKYKVIALNATCLSPMTSRMPRFFALRLPRGLFHGTGRPGLRLLLRTDAEKGEEILHPVPGLFLRSPDRRWLQEGPERVLPEAQLVGEDYHKLFLTDFAPYLTKIKAAGAEVIYTGDWFPDAGNLLKQARQMKIMLPFANVYMDTPDFLNEIGVEGTKGLTNLSTFFTANPQFKEPGTPRCTRPGTTSGRTSGRPRPTTAVPSRSTAATGVPGPTSRTGS
jgi:ABC-type branched-subunit amino acid transport system substrate-binding protein